MLAKGPVNAQKTVRLINRLRELARSHKGLTACNRRSACHTHSLWERACSRKGRYRAPKTARLINRLRERARSHKGLTAFNRRSACHTHSLWEPTCSRKGRYRLRNSAPDQSPSRASSLPQGAYCMQSAERLPHALPVGASLLAKGPVNAPKTVRLIHRIREQARSHKGLTAFNRRSACHTHSLWERACSRKGRYRLRKQRA